jgi:hypothetical protein
VYTPEQKAKAEEYVQHERNVTLRLYGKTEDELTPEQDSALTDYVRVSAAIYLAKWGPEGPRGAVLRAETDAEAEARIEWEESIKTPEQKRKERVCNLITFNLEGCTDDSQSVRLCWYEEMEDRWREKYISEGQASDQDAMYDVIATVYTSTGRVEHDRYDVRLAVAVSPDEAVSIVAVWVNLFEVEFKDYHDYIAHVSEVEE